MLKGEDRKVLELRPRNYKCSIYKNIIMKNNFRTAENALEYNDFPDKAKMNLDYYYNHNLLLDIKIHY
jgi:hypothetical protein